MKTGSMVCFVISGLATLVAIKNVVVDGANRPEGVENVVGYAVGSFLIPVALLIVGLMLRQKAGANRDDA